MFDANELMKQLKISQNEPKAAQTINNLKSFMGTEQGKNLASNISKDTAVQIEKAAKAMQKGDKTAASAALSQILSTSEGKNLAMQLKKIIGK